MPRTISAETDSEMIRALREEGSEIVFQVNEQKSLGEILSEIDWSRYEAEAYTGPEIESVREPVYYLDEDHGQPRYRKAAY